MRLSSALRPPPDCRIQKAPRTTWRGFSETISGRYLAARIERKPDAEGLLPGGTFGALERFCNFGGGRFFLRHGLQRADMFCRPSNSFFLLSHARAISCLQYDGGL